MPVEPGKLDAAETSGPKDGPKHPSPRESGKTQDLEIAQ